MKTLIIGIGGMTNGGKSTLSKSLHEQLPNSCMISQDSFFKDDSVVPVDSQGFKQYDMLSALHMDRMMEEVKAWQADPRAFRASHHGGFKPLTQAADEQVFVLIIEGFLIFNYRPLNELMNRRYFLQIPYDTCMKRRSSRVYNPPDPPGYFDGHVWPMYLKNREEMEEMVTDLVFLDGLTEREKLLSTVLQDVTADMEALRDEGDLSAVESWASCYCWQTEGSDVPHGSGIQSNQQFSEEETMVLPSLKP